MSAFLLVVAFGMVAQNHKNPPASLKSANADYTYGQGYALVGSDGGVYNYGNQGFYGSEGGHGLTNVVGMAIPPAATGYWVTTGTGTVYSFGTTPGDWSYSRPPLAKPIAGMAATADGGGYWLVGADGGLFNYGDAPYLRSLPQDGVTPNKPVVGIVGTPDDQGYWMVGADGAVYAFGDATFYGSMGGDTLNAPVVGMASNPSGTGYWLVGSDGGIYSFGSATFYGSPGSTSLPKPIVGMASSPDGLGYWLVGSDGGVLQYGDAQFVGAVVQPAGLGGPIVGIEAPPPELDLCAPIGGNWNTTAATEVGLGCNGYSTGWAWYENTAANVGGGAITFGWGGSALSESSCTPITGNWNTTAASEVGLACYSSSSGWTWYENTAANVGGGAITFGWGGSSLSASSCSPISGYWNTTSASEVGLACYSSSSGWTWYENTAANVGGGAITFGWGGSSLSASSCSPISGHWNTTSASEVGLACYSSSGWTWYENTAANVGGGAITFGWGGSTPSGTICSPITGNWNTTSASEVGLACYSSSGWAWYENSAANEGGGATTFGWGGSGLHDRF